MYPCLYSNTLYKHQDVAVPCMLIWAEADNILVEGMSGGTRPYARGPVVIHTVPECSHWVQQDRPEIVNKLLWDFVLDKDIVKKQAGQTSGSPVKEAMNGDINHDSL